MENGSHDRKFYLGKYCPIFPKAEGKKSYRNYRWLLETYKQPVQLPRAQALEPRCLDLSNVTGHINHLFLSVSSFKMEIKIPASYGCRHK